MKKYLCVILFIAIMLCNACISGERIIEDKEANINNKESEIRESIAKSEKSVTEAISNSEDSMTQIEEIIEYDDNTHNIVSFYDFELVLSGYYVSKYIDNGNHCTVFIDSDEESDIYKPRVLHITKSINILLNESQVSHYFSQFGTFQELLHYQNININKINEIYKAVYEDFSCYLIRYKQEIYLIKTDLPSLQRKLVSLTIDECLSTQIVLSQINGCGLNKQTLYVVSKRDILNNKITVTCSENKDGNIGTFILNVGKKNPYKAEMNIYMNEKEIQTLNWEYETVSEYVPEMMDLNLDGYVDFAVAYAEGTQNKEYYFFVWNTEIHQYENVTPEGLLSADFQIEEGQIINWGANTDGFVMETFKWDRYSLVKTDERIVKPEE